MAVQREGRCGVGRGQRKASATPGQRWLPVMPGRRKVGGAGARRGCETNPGNGEEKVPLGEKQMGRGVG